MSVPSLLRLVLALVALAHVGLAIAWFALNLGDVPPYGDSWEYISLAQNMKVDSYRGVLYPLLLRGLDQLHGGASYLFELNQDFSLGPRDTAQGFLPVQLFQLVCGVAAIVYFVARMTNPLGGGARRTAARVGVLAITLLVALDPLVAHFWASVMADGLALAASLAFVAALSDLSLRRGRAWVAGAVLLASHVTTAGLRVEKTTILVLTTLGALAAWRWMARRKGESPRPRVLLPIAVVAAGILINVGLARAFHEEKGRWPPKISILHQRVIFPNLEAVHGSLPGQVKRRIPKRQAKLYDEHINSMRLVMNRASFGDLEELERLTDAMVPVVWERKWQWIVLDTIKDTLENVAATGSYYYRLLVIARGGEPLYRETFHSDGAFWTYSRMLHHHPRMSRAFVISGVTVSLVGVVLAVGALARSRRRPDAASIVPWRAWVPVLLFVVLNAGAFAATMDMVHVRYALFAHAVFLVLVYRAALGLLFPAGGPAEVNPD